MPELQSQHRSQPFINAFSDQQYHSSLRLMHSFDSHAFHGPLPVVGDAGKLVQHLHFLIPFLTSPVAFPSRDSTTMAFFNFSSVPFLIFSMPQDLRPLLNL